MEKSDGGRDCSELVNDFFLWWQQLNTSHLLLFFSNISYEWISFLLAYREFISAVNSFHQPHIYFMTYIYKEFLLICKQLNANFLQMDYDYFNIVIHLSFYAPV